MRPKPSNRQVLAFMAMTTASLFTSSSTTAQVHIDPDLRGMPDVSVLSRVGVWGAGMVLVACGCALIYGGATWRHGTRTTNRYATRRGKEYVSGGLIVALVVLAASTMF
jgi:hypothetical protein